MLSKKPNKQELRTKETRELLLRAAETIFVRDGYEKAELGEIATLAGRTKGAIYAQFKSKEDIFLALVEEKAQHNRNAVLEKLSTSTSIEQNLATVRQFFLSISENQAWTLLLLEFKLYAIRHPESKERLQKLYETINPTDREEMLIRVLGPTGKGKDTMSRTLAVQILQPLLSALAVEAKFAPDLLDEEATKKIAGRVFDVLLPPNTTGAS
ncbi:MAG TPA: TetR/AcrR family transcriptional regulator [Edaphobacter sp.]|jgi:AcrR family transcriptional regulator